MNKKGDCSKHKQAEARQWHIRIELPVPLMISSESARQGSAKESLNVALA